MIKKWKITGVGEYVEKLEPSVIDEIIKWGRCFGKESDGSS